MTWSTCRNCRVRPSATGANCGWCTTCVEAVARDAGLDPLEPFRSTRTSWRCRCLTCGRETYPTVQNLLQGHGCRHCGPRLAAERRIAADAENARAELAAIGLIPLEPYPGSQRPWTSRCLSCQTEVSPTISNVRAGRTQSCGRGCRPPARPQLWTHDAVVALIEEEGFRPIAPVVATRTGVSAKWRVRCPGCGNEILVQPNRLVTNASGCRGCAGAAAGDAQRTPEAVAVATMLAVGLQPLEPYRSAQTPWRCRCDTCLDECTPTYWSVRQGRGTGLCSCSNKGIRADDQAYVYLVERTDGAVRKVGIGKAGSIRLSENSWQGFTRVLELAYCPGAAARAVERHMLQELTRRGCRGAVRPEDMPFSGYRETFPTAGNGDLTLTGLAPEVLTGAAAQAAPELRLADNPVAAAVFMEKYRSSGQR